MGQILPKILEYDINGFRRYSVLYPHKSRGVVTPPAPSYTATISPSTGITYYDTTLSASTDMTGSTTFVWTLNNFRDQDGFEVSSYTGATLVRGYFTTDDSNNVSVVATSDDGTASSSDFTLTEQAPTIYVAGGGAGTPGTLALVSNDAINWSSETATQSSHTFGAYGNRIAVLGREAGGTFNRLSMTTGSTWSTPSFSTGNRMTQMRWVPYLGKFFSGVWDSTKPAYSSDALSWSTTTGSLASDRYSMLVDNDNEEILYMADNGYVYATYSGASFTNVHTFPGSALHKTAIRNETLGLSIAIEQTTNGPVYYSEDNRTWSAATGTMPGTSWDDSITYRPSDGRMVVVSYTSATGMTSDDGITWTQMVMPDIDGSWYLGVEWVEGLNLFVSANRTGKIVTSPDGTTWTQRTQSVVQDSFLVMSGYKRAEV